MTIKASRKKKKERKATTTDTDRFAPLILHGSSRPVCPVIARDKGGECRPSAISDSEWWASPCITASPSRSLSA